MAIQFGGFVGFGWYFGGFGFRLVKFGGMVVWVCGGVLSWLACACVFVTVWITSRGNIWVGLCV